MEVDYCMNKYKKQLKDMVKWSPQYILHIFEVTDYALKESFLNIVAKENPTYIVSSNSKDDVNLYFDASIYSFNSWIDVYDVLSVFNIINPAYQHAIKKILNTGKRGHKDFQRDLLDIIASLSRA